MILVEERSSAECENKKLIDERANLEEAISNLEQTAQVAYQKHRLEKVQEKLSKIFFYRFQWLWNPKNMLYNWKLII